MKRTWLLCGLLLVLAFASVGHADTAMSGKAGRYTVDATFEKLPPSRGENTLVISIKDSAARDVTDVAVSVRYYMTQRTTPTQKSVEMPYMGSEVAAQLHGSTYKAQVNLSMAGGWHVDVKITDGQGSSTAGLYVVVPGQ